MVTRRNVVVLSSLVFAVVLFTTAWSVLAVGEDGAAWPPDTGPRFDGAWIVAAPSPSGSTIIHTSLQTARDIHGLRYTVVMEHSQCSPTVWGMFPEANKQTNMVGYSEKTGPTTNRGTMIGYGIKTGEVEDELVYIEVCSYESELVGDNTAVNTATQSFYTPDQDTDGDGFPDEGQEPVLCMPYTVNVRRVTFVPMCVPTPMP